ncbi:MAG: AAA family ATPase [Thermoguttaceae bacterium]
MSEGFVRMSNHVPAPRQWLWPGRIPMGCLTLLDGDPGTNKSTLIYEIAARVTTGRAMYGSDERHAAANVVLLQAEDTLDDIHNRLTACGADLTRVLAYDRHGEHIVLPRDVQRIEALIREYQVRLLAIDPLMNFLGGSANNYQAVQRSLGPLVSMAEQTGVAVVLARHLNQSGGSNPLYRGLGSIGVMGAVRSGLLLAVDPADHERRVLAQTKTNLGAISESLSLRPLEIGEGVAVEWLGTSPHSAITLLEAAGGRSRPELDEAMYFLFATLAGGPVLQREVHTAARQEGITPRTLRRAREALGIVSHRDGFGRGGRHYWQLPDDDTAYVHLRERMEADLAAQGWHHQEADVPDDEEAPPDDEGVVTDVEGVQPTGPATSTEDSAPLSVVPENIVWPVSSRGMMIIRGRRPSPPRNPPAVPSPPDNTSPRQTEQGDSSAGPPNPV